MENDQNWYRQLLALVLLSASRAAVEFIVNPNSRSEATGQLRDAFREIDYEAAAKAVTQVIDNMAESSKFRLTDAVDTLRDRGVDAVDTAKTRAEKQLGQQKSGRKFRFVVGLVLGGILAFYFMDEQRRDDLLDRLTGASGPIQQNPSNVYQQAATAAQDAASNAPSGNRTAAQQAATETREVADQAGGS
ncbi:MAG TPA: hypothetical protein VF898_09720 [Chloroflexota bacterium]